ncbi:MAG: recombination protein RecR, partial [Alphaproteobacteria bacterium]|nr:recombination protein RecR [Alphaproteobacteria bacterium]
MAVSHIDQLIGLLARLPGLGPRSARRAALQLLKKRDSLLAPLASALTQAAETIRSCGQCGNLDTVDPCAICGDAKRDDSVICVVEEVADLWAVERSGVYRG